MPDFTRMPRGAYAYVQLTDGRVACQLAQPIDPLVIPFLKGPIVAHVCEARPVPVGEVIQAAEDITRRAAGAPDTPKFIQ